jgi:Predicted glycosyltransferases
MDLVVGIVTYNNSKIIKQTLDSIIQNTRGIEYKIVVVDNNSQDRTIQEIESSDYPITLIRNRKNHGFGYGHNQILNLFTAEYYLICNPDIILKSNVLLKLFNYMERRTDVGMVSPRIVFPGGQMQYLCKQNPSVFDLFIRRFLPGCLKKFCESREFWFQMRYTGYDREFVVPYASGCFMFYRGEILRRLGGFDEAFFLHMEDADISRRTNEISKCVYYPDAVVEHLWARGNHTSSKQTLITIKSVFHYFNKWGWVFY